jgi:outer membrane protein OmpU
MAELGSCDTTKETEMKKALLATAALLSGVGAAYAEDGYSISGSGRFGLEFSSPDVGDSETNLDTRLRFNINASKATDAGVTLGGRIRLQYDDGAGYEGGGGARLSAAYVFAEASGFRVEVGNANAAYDSAGLMYNSEVGTGYYGSSNGNPLGSYYGFSTGPYSAAEADRMGIYIEYGVGDLTARLSWITPDQTADDTDDEVSVSFDYSTGPFSVSLAAAQNGGGIADNDLFFLGAQYAVNDNANVGILFHGNGEVAGVEVGDSIALYGNISFGATTVQAYLASIDSDTVTEDLAVGIGANYDLGGASLGGSIEQGFDGGTFAKLGVGFSF